MNDEQWEKAAREYCRLAKVNPDKRVEWGGCWNECSNGPTCDVYVDCARWQNIAEHMKQHAAMNAAIEFAQHTTTENDRGQQS